MDQNWPESWTENFSKKFYFIPIFENIYVWGCFGQKKMFWSKWVTNGLKARLKKKESQNGPKATVHPSPVSCRGTHDTLLV